MGQLKRLSVGPNLVNPSAISQLYNLEELALNGCKKLPSFDKLKKLKKLCIAGSELAIVDAKYRIDDLGFLSDLIALEFLDLQHTSYKGSLDTLDSLTNLKAVSLPRVSRGRIENFKSKHKKCMIINAYEW